MFAHLQVTTYDTTPPSRRQLQLLDETRQIEKKTREDGRHFPSCCGSTSAFAGEYCWENALQDPAKIGFEPAKSEVEGANRIWFLHKTNQLRE